MKKRLVGPIGRFPAAMKEEEFRAEVYPSVPKKKVLKTAFEEKKSFRGLSIEPFEESKVGIWEARGIQKAMNICTTAEESFVAIKLQLLLTGIALFATLPAKP